MKFNPTELIRARDGSLSMTKLAACTGHVLFAIAFYKFQIFRYDAIFNETIWVVYGGFAMGHALLDKTSQQVAAFKDRQQDVIENTSAPANTDLKETTEDAAGATKVKTLKRTKATTTTGA